MWRGTGWRERSERLNSDAGPVATEVIASTLGATIALHERLRHGDTTPIAKAANAIASALKSGGKLLVLGNGGSAADAQHVAAELVGRFERERAPLAAVALTADTSVLTSLANDCGFDRVFALQVDALAKPGDVVLAISTSGESPNVIAALTSARGRGVVTVALTGRDGGTAGRSADIHINVPADSTPRVQEVHRTLLHVICDLVERAVAQ